MSRISDEGCVFTQRQSWDSCQIRAAAVVFSLFAVTTYGVTPYFHPERPIIDALAARTQESMALTIATTLEKNLLPLEIREKPRYESVIYSRRNFFGWHGCGFGSSSVVEERTTRLPVDPVLVLGEGYLKCRMITAATLEPLVSVSSYPTGYFGDNVQEGLLIMDRFEFCDEARLRQIFQLLTEAAKAPDDGDEIGFYELDDQELRIADYRKATRFLPEFLFEFVGGNPLRVEIDPTGGRLLIQADDKWSGYSLDRESAVALKAILQVEQKRPDLRGDNDHGREN